MSTPVTGYAGLARGLHFDGDVDKYERWECKLLTHMKIKSLKNIFLPGTVASVDKREQAFAELVHFIDDRSLNLIMRDAKDDGRKALEILRSHYAGKGEQRCITLFTTLTSLVKQPDEDLTDYIIRAETAAAALQSIGHPVEDAMLIAMVMKGLPSTYKPFTVVITQNDKMMNFQEFKAAIRTFEENERASIDLSNKISNVLKLHDDDGYTNQNHNNNNNNNG